MGGLHQQCDALEARISRLESARGGDLDRPALLQLIAEAGGVVRSAAPDEFAPDAPLIVLGAAGDGRAPFSADVRPNAVSAANCTAVDAAGVAGQDGLTAGFFERTASCVIEARDEFGNMNPYGPRAEVQVVAVFAEAPAAVPPSSESLPASM